MGWIQDIFKPLLVLIKGDIKANAQAISATDTADITGLSTTDKSSLVGAINEVKSNVGLAAVIDDNVTNTSNAWSSDKISTEISTSIQGVINAAPGALDTLDELAQALGDDPNFATTVATSLSKRVAVDNAQSFSAAEMQQGRNNLDVYSRGEIGDITEDLSSYYLSL